MKLVKSSSRKTLLVLNLVISAGLIVLTGRAKSTSNNPKENTETLLGTAPKTLPISASISVVADPFLEEIKSIDPDEQISE